VGSSGLLYGKHPAARAYRVGAGAAAPHEGGTENELPLAEQDEIGFMPAASYGNREITGENAMTLFYPPGFSDKLGAFHGTP